MALDVKRAALFLNGTPPKREIIEAVYSDYRRGLINAVYCTDGAYSYLSKVFLPNAVIGDFDSQSIDCVAGVCEKITFNPDKDFTDGFLAVKIAAEREIGVLDIYGGYGGRPDMAESNYLLLALARKLKIQARFCGEWSTYLIGEKFTAQTKKEHTVSVVPFTDSVHILYMKGLRYGLRNYVMTKFDAVDSPDYIMGVSNVSCGERVEMEVTDGLALVFIQE